MADVFISYARSTAGFAKALSEALRSHGYSVWFDESLPSHRPYADVIEEELDKAKAVVVIWSRDATRSQWVRSEANRARERRKLVQLNADCSVLPMPFDQIGCPSLEHWDGRADATALEPVLFSIAELVRAQDEAGGVRPAGENVAAPVIAFVDPEAELLFQAAAHYLQEGRPEQQAQAIPLLNEAVQIAPTYADAWGMLAVLYAVRKRQVAPAERTAWEARSLSAAKTALKLNPADDRARCAKIWLVPAFRNWAMKSAMARDVLKDVSDQPLALFSLAWVQGETGCWSASAESCARISRTKFLLPAVDRQLILSLWSSGELSRAEVMMSRAASRWPLHREIQELRIEVLMHSGRARDALPLIEAARARPGDFSADRWRVAAVTAQGLDGMIPVDQAVGANLAAAREGDLSPLTAAQRITAFGDPATALDLLEGYYLARGRYAALAPEGGDEDRLTGTLFTPPMLPLWTERRFAALLSTVGLQGYWSDSGVTPDFLGHNA